MTIEKVGGNPCDRPIVDRATVAPRRPMIRKLKSGEYRLYSRRKDPRTGRRPRSTSARCNSSSAAAARARIRQRADDLEAPFALPESAAKRNGMKPQFFAF